jgi:hypothetical protein
MRDMECLRTGSPRDEVGSVARGRQGRANAASPFAPLHDGGNVPELRGAAGPLPAPAWWMGVTAASSLLPGPVIPASTRYETAAREGAW